MKTNPGINFIQVSVTELNFKLNNKFKLPKKGIPVDLALNIKVSFSRDKKNLTVILTADLFQKAKGAPFKMKVSIKGVFVGKKHEELKKFAEVHAPAHLMPFLRETIGNTTMKAHLPPLLLPPFNVSEILKAAKRKKQKA